MAMSVSTDGTPGTEETDLITINSTIKWDLFAYNLSANQYYLRNYNGYYLGFSSGSVIASTNLINASIWTFYECGNSSVLPPEAHGYMSKINNSNLINGMNCYAYSLMAYVDYHPELFNYDFNSSNELVWNIPKLQMGNLSNTYINLGDYAYNYSDHYCSQTINDENDEVFTLNNKGFVKIYREVISMVNSDLNAIYGTDDNVIGCGGDYQHFSQPSTGEWRKVAFAITGSYLNGQFDYHWYVEDNDGYWYHKPGEAMVRNIDNSGNLISDPRGADRGIYTRFSGYFLIRCDSSLKKITVNSNSFYDSPLDVSVDTSDAGDTLQQAKPVSFVLGSIYTSATLNGQISYSTKDVTVIHDFFDINNYNYYTYKFILYSNTWHYIKKYHDIQNGTITDVSLINTGLSYSVASSDIVNYMISNELPTSIDNENNYYSPTLRRDSYDMPSDVDFYEFMVDTSGTYEIYSELIDSTTNLDPYGFLYQNDSLLTYNDDGGTGHNFKITYYLKPGIVYRISITGFNSQQTGSYKIIIKKT